VDKQNRFVVLFVFIATASFAFCISFGKEVGKAGTGNYNDLISLFNEFRELEKPKVVGGVPDYTPVAMAEQRKALRKLQTRLTAMDASGWPISQQVDYRIVRAEMNKLDFFQRVLKPWARDPVFYLQTQAGVRPTRYGSLGIHRLPIPDEEMPDFRMKLKALPLILKQAKSNLTEGAADLALIALHYMDTETDYFTRVLKALKEHHPAFIPDAERALAAVQDYGEWLKQNKSKMTAPAGVGIENYNWWMKNVQLLPYTWNELMDIVMHEDDRMITTLELERNRNRKLPELEPVENQQDHRSRRDQAIAFIQEFLKQEEILTVPDFLSVEEYLSQGPLPVPQRWPRDRDFFEQTGDREPLPEQTHEFIGHSLGEQRLQRDNRPIRGKISFDTLGMIRNEGWAFWLEEMLMHAGYLDARPRRAREIVYLQAAFRTCRAVADLKMHSNEFSLREAMDYCVQCAPNHWLLRDGPHVWAEMQTTLRAVGWHTGMVVGKFQFMKLFRDCVKQRGGNFKLLEFMDEFLAAGVIPISLIRWEMIGLTDEIEKLR